MNMVWTGAIGLLFATTVVDAAYAQIRPDRTLGSESSRVRGDRIPGRDGLTRDSDVIEGGARRGNNLFHSFRQFDLPAGRGAYFSDPSGVTRIFSRVTGNDRSEINGTLGVLGNADLYFINPNGILFGPRASLDLGGSFTATTASAIVLGEASFSATDPELPSGLLRVDPSAFLFNQLSSGNIVSRAAGDSGLQVVNGETLRLLGGDVAIRGGLLNAWGGQVEVGAVASEGTVELAEEGRLLFPDGLLRADVLFNDAFIDVSLDDGGDINIVGDRIDIESNSVIRAGIDSRFGTIRSQSGDIQLNGNAIRIIQNSQIDNNVREGYSGNAGNIRINSNSLLVQGGSQLATNTLGRGRAGSVIINTRDQVQVQGSETGISSSSGSIVSTEEVIKVVTVGGRGGDIHITTGNFSLLDGALFDVSTLGRSRAGNVIINAREQVQLRGDGTTIINRSGTIAPPREVIRASGRGGDIRINADSLFLLNGGQLDVSAFGSGRAGSVIINAQNQVHLQDDGTNIFSRSGGRFEGEVIQARGRGGDVRISTGNLFLSNGARLDASTFGQGRAGNVSINAGQVSFDNSDIFSNVGEKGGGRGGNVNITADFLSLTRGAQLNVITFGQGNAGNVSINAEQVSFDGTSPNGQFSSGAFSNVGRNGGGRGGNVTITADSLSLTRGAQLSASTLGQGDAGNVIINVKDLVQLDQSSTISATAESTATKPSGDIEITASGLRLFNNSAIRTDDRRTGNVQGGGGNIRVDANYILATDGGDILTFSDRGTGGNIDLPSFFSEGDAVVDEQNQLNRDQQNQLDRNDRIDINASGNVSRGIIDLTTPDTSAIQNSLSDLPANAIDPDSLIVNSCIARTRTGGTFLITGTGGLPTDRPNALPPADYPTGTVRSEPDDSTWQPGDPIVEPQGVYQLPNGTLLLSRNCSAPSQ